jgi:biopolymer transport protein ExbD
MAEVEQSSDSGHGKKGGSKTKKKSTKVDMTAMVDVAFLLLTFFVLTASMSSNSIISLTLPPKADDIDREEKTKKMREDKIMTLVLDEDDKIKYYVGAANEETELKTTNYSASGLRSVLLDHLNYGPENGTPMCKDVNDQGINEGRCWDPIFVVKPREESRYKNLVDILDEFAITEANKYAIDDFLEADSVFLADHVNPSEEEEEE